MLICAKCGSTPGKCTCCVASPLQAMVQDQKADGYLWGHSDNDMIKRLQKAILDLHQEIENQRTTGRE